MRHPVIGGSMFLVSIVACAPMSAGNDAASACVFVSPSGPGVSGLTVEGCTFEGGPAGIASPADLRAVAVEPGGNTIYLLYGPAGHRTLARFTDDTAAGCHLRRDGAWTAPTTGPEDALYADVASDGSVFVASANVVAWSGGHSGTCAHVDPGLGARASMQIGSDFHIVAPNAGGAARLLDTTSCTYSDAAFGPAVTRGAGRVASDYVFVTASNVQRYDANGSLLWNGTGSIDSGGEIRPCGSDVCVMESGASGLARFSGINGARSVVYAWADLFGNTFDGPGSRIDACPGGSTIAVAWAVAQDARCPSAESAQSAVAVVRIRGF